MQRLALCDLDDTLIDRRRARVRRCRSSAGRRTGPRVGTLVARGRRQISAS